MLFYCLGSKHAPKNHLRLNFELVKRFDLCSEKFSRVTCSVGGQRIAPVRDEQKRKRRLSPPRHKAAAFFATVWQAAAGSI
jgi:hypothetical protein